MTFSPLRTDQARALGERVAEFGRAQKHAVLEDLGARLPTLDAVERDRLSTELMGVYRDTHANEAFSLLFELNQEGVLRLVYHHLRRSFFAVDANDVLQEVFFNIYRYPDRFDPSRPPSATGRTRSSATPRSSTRGARSATTSSASAAAAATSARTTPASSIRPTNTPTPRSKKRNSTRPTTNSSAPGCSTCTSTSTPTRACRRPRSARSSSSK
jgi:hypothetical protein